MARRNICNRKSPGFPSLALLGALMLGSFLWLAASLKAADNPPQKLSADFLKTLTAPEREWLRQHPVIRVAPDPSWPPIEFANENGEHSGMSKDYLSLIEQRLGIKFQEIASQNWEEAFARLKNLEADMTTCVVPTPLRQQLWIFTRPYLVRPVVIATRMDVTFIAGIQELAGKKVAMVRDYAVTELVSRDFPEVQVVPVKSALEGLRLLQSGRVFAYVDNMLIIGYYQATMKIDNIKIAGQTPYRNALCMAVRKDWPLLAGILQKALNSISASEGDEIYRKWLPLSVERGFNYTRLWQLLAAFAVIVGALVFWNRKLAAEIRSRLRAEDALLDSEARYRILFREMFNGFALHEILADERGQPVEFRFIAANPAFERITGLKAGEIISRPVREVLPDIMAQVSETYRKVALSGEPAYLEINLPERKQHLELTAYRPAPGQLACIFADVTARKQAEEEKSRLEGQLRQAQKMDSIGRLAGGVAHDFNNMLGVILGHIDLALHEGGLNSPLMAHLEEIGKAADRSADLTRQLLAFARQQTVIPRVLDLNQSVENMLKMLQRLIGENIALVWTPADGLWPVKMDPTQVDQILANLCVNARDAIGGVGTIAIATGNSTLDEDYCAAHAGFTPGDYARLTVSDTGCGMDREMLAKIFEPFFTTKELGKGTGLGLATVYGAIKQNSGAITVYSEPGRGTTFTIYLPREWGGDVPALAEAKPDAALRGDETILLVEDEPSILGLAVKILCLQGYHVLSASTPGEAIHLARSYAGPIHLLLTDVIMPEMNGYDLARMLLTIKPRLRPLFMSGYTSDVIAHNGVLDGDVIFLQKPFTRADLAAKVRVALDG